MADRIDTDYDYAVCAWARHFNVSEKRVKEAVAAVGDDADKVREHLGAGHGQSGIFFNNGNHGRSQSTP